MPEPFIRRTIRIGLGHDTHRLEPGGPLRIGGMDIPFDHQAVGHSDADVLLHAITDAILGAAALGDIGQLFPDTDVANRHKDSGEMLQVAADKVTAAGYAIVNLDCVVMAQRPKILPFRDPMRARIAELLSIDTDQVSLKGKTGEGVGEVGRGEIIQAMVVCLLERG